MPMSDERWAVWGRDHAVGTATALRRWAKKLSFVYPTTDIGKAKRDQVIDELVQKARRLETFAREFDHVHLSDEVDHVHPPEKGDPE